MNDKPTRIGWTHGRSYACLASATAVSVCLATLLGWVANSGAALRNGLQSPAITAETALGFGLLSLGILAVALQPPAGAHYGLLGKAVTMIGRIVALAAPATLVALELIGDDAPGNLSVVGMGDTAMLAMCVTGASATGLSLWAQSSTSPLHRWWPVPALLVLGLAYAVMMARMIDPTLRPVMPTALLMLLVSTAVLGLHSFRNTLVETLSLPAGWEPFVRPILLLTLLSPTLIGWARVLTQAAGEQQPGLLAVTAFATFALAAAVAITLAPSPRAAARRKGETGADRDAPAVHAHEPVHADEHPDYRRLERELASERQARIAAEQANSRRAAYFVRMNHELRTPLTSVLGFARLLDMDPADPLSLAQRGKMLHIERAGRQVLNLVDDLLDIGRIDAGQLRMRPAMIRLKPLLEHAVQLVSPIAGEAGVVVSLRDMPAGVEVWADELRLSQALVNLLSNAIKYNRSAGRVWITIEVDATRATALTDAEPAQTLALHVFDTGIGIRAIDQLHLFEPFNRLGQEATRIEGTGLGLTLTRTLVEAMHGRIEARSEWGHGSEFTLWLRQSPLPA